MSRLTQLLRYHNLLFVFLLRVPAIAAMNLAFNQALHRQFGSTDSTIFGIMLTALAVFCFMIKERSDRRAVYVTLTAAASVLFYLAAAPYASSAFRTGAAVTLAVYTLIFDTRMYTRSQFVYWVIIFAAVYAVSSLSFNQALLSAATQCILATLACEVCCRVLRNAEALVYSVRCRESPASTVRKMLMRCYKMFGVVLVVLVAAGLLAARPTIPTGNADHLPPQEYLTGVEAPSQQSPERVEYLETEIVASESPVLQPKDGDYTINEAYRMVWVVIFVVLCTASLLLMGGHGKRARQDFAEYDEDVAVEDAYNRRRVRRISVAHDRRLAVRRMFRRKVREHRRKGTITVTKSDTPKQLADRIAATEDVQHLEELYHRARYAAEDSGDTDLM